MCLNFYIYVIENIQELIKNYYNILLFLFMLRVIEIMLSSFY
jgi:hypothetical protein